MNPKFSAELNSPVKKYPDTSRKKILHLGYIHSDLSIEIAQ